MMDKPLSPEELARLNRSCGLAPDDMPQIVQALAKDDQDLLATRCIELEAMVKECIEAMEYAVNHEHEAWKHEPIATEICEFCDRIEPLIHRAKEMLGVK